MNIIFCFFQLTLRNVTHWLGMSSRFDPPLSEIKDTLFKALQRIVSGKSSSL